MDIPATIKSVENKYRTSLESFFSDNWRNTSLFSHGIDHHRRVWHYAKELLLAIKKGENNEIQISPEELIIACYLHDLGLSENPGIKHGVQSSILCRQFLSERGLEPDNFKEVLNAIIDHDDKEYNRYNTRTTLATLLSIADDLDAFGYIGAYRYIEIYLTRDVSPEMIGYQARENALKRFQNFKTVFADHHDLISEHGERYLCLDSFFERYNQDADNMRFRENQYSGYKKITDLISEIIRDKIPPEIFFAESQKLHQEDIVNEFASNFCLEYAGFIT